MGFDFRDFADDGLNESFVDWLVDGQWGEIGSHFGRMWEYYHNQTFELDSISGVDGQALGVSRRYVQAQEAGLPSRITGFVYSGSGSNISGRSIGDVSRKEVVIENDIAWRINAAVDFLFGKGVSFVSTVADAEKRREIEQIIKSVFAANGSAGFLQDMAVLGSVYGFVDCMVRVGEEVLQSQHNSISTSGPGGRGSSQKSSFESILQLASCIGLELIEAPRALPILDENDYRKTNYYVQHFYQQKNSVSEEGGFIRRLINGKGGGDKRQRVAVTEVIGPRWWQRYENRELVAEGENVVGLVPVVHIQNIAQPYYYEGLSDVEQLIGLQDELNTRLSDRASRVTFQSFKMYLAKGIEGFEDKPVSPGRMWSTDNTDASIEEFGGDGPVPSEDIHIREIREAIDKVSGVTPVVAGLLKNKIGNLTSGVALKMTFMGMLARTARKQFTYGEGLKEICRVVLGALDSCGVYSTDPSEREMDILFPNPLPENIMEKLEAAQMKKAIGVSQEEVLRELGYVS